MAIARDKEHQRALLAAHEDRLRVLELRRAREGIAVAPEVETEIAQIQASIAVLRPALEPPVSEATTKALSADDRYQGHVAWQMRFDDAIYRLSRRLDRITLVLIVWAGIVLLLVGAYSVDWFYRWR